MLRTFFIFAFLSSTVFSVTSGVCSSTDATNGYNCDCELRYVCSPSPTIHSVSANGNDFQLLTELTGQPLGRTFGVFLAGDRQRKPKNQRNYCDQLCQGRAQAILGIHATNADQHIGYNHLAKLLDERNSVDTVGKCCGIFIASKRRWCTEENEWHRVKYGQDFEYYKKTVSTYDFFTTDVCGTGDPFPTGLQVSSTP